MLVLLAFSKDGVETEANRWPSALPMLLDVHLNHRLNISLRVGLCPRAGKEVLQGSFDSDVLLYFFEGGL